MTSELDAALRILDVILEHCLIDLLLCLFPWILLRVCPDCLKFPGSDELDESDKEESYELGSKSRSFGTCGMFLGRLLNDIAFSIVVLPVGSDCQFGGGGGSFVPEYGMCTVYFVRTDDKLLSTRGFFVFTVLCIARRSVVVLNFGTDVFCQIRCCNKLGSDVSC